MAQDFEVTVRLRLTVNDPQALLAAAGDVVPEPLRDDQLVAIQVALQSLVDPPDVEQLPGVSWRSSPGWRSQVQAEALQD